MAYFIVMRSADSALSLPVPDAFDTREAAVEALSAAASSGALVVEGEIFISDLGAALPVLVLQTAPAVAVQEPAEEPPVPASAVAESAYTPWAPLQELEDEGSLAAALKRAASTLEDEGIVAPASVEAAERGDVPQPSFVEETEIEPPAPEPLDSTEAEAPEAETEAEVPEIEAEAVPHAAEDQPWPWTNVEAYTPAVDEPRAVVDVQEPTLNDIARFAPEPELPAEQVIEPMSVHYGATEASVIEAVTEQVEDEVLDEETAILTSAPISGEEAYIPKPVILGDYADVATPAATDPDIILPVKTVPVLETGYAATGDLDLAGYTCQDCIYSNTCPKVGQSSPKDCGSFQWRSE
ncbi:MAG: hypothetical protein ACYCXZ_01630 [Coriobacteriia bacterium]